MMKFRFVCIFITTLTCVLNVAFTSYVQNLDSSETISTPLIRETVSIDEQRSKCYEEFTQKTHDFLAQIKKRSLDCDHVIESAKSKLEENNGNARKVFQSFVQDKMKSNQDALQKCSEKISTTEYFECVRGLETAQREFLDEITVKSRDYFNKLEKLKENELYCLKKVVDEQKICSAGFTLKRCLQQISEPILSSTTSSTLVPKLSDEMTEYLTKLKSLYFKLQDCTSHSTFEICMYGKAKDNRKLKDYLSEHAVKYFPKLNEIDKTEDICLRHLLFHLTSDTPYIAQNELSDCFQTGRAKSANCDDIDVNKIRQLEMLFNSLFECRHGDSSERQECVSEALSRSRTNLVVECISILNENIEQAVTSIDVPEDNDRDCFRFALKKLQFNGMFLNSSDKEGFAHCYLNS